EDFDHWRQSGCTGWGYDEVLPYFKKAEDNEIGADEYHNVGGPLRVSHPPRNELCDAFIEAGIQAGHRPDDYSNAARHDGFGYNQLTTRNGRRCNTSSAYLNPARGRANLRIVTNALATRLLFENGAARGVEFKRNGAIETIRARREVILSGGA